MVGSPLLGWHMRFQLRWTNLRQLFSQRFKMISLATRKTFEMVFSSSFCNWGFRSRLNPKLRLVLNLIIVMIINQYEITNTHWMRMLEVHHPILFISLKKQERYPFWIAPCFLVSPFSRGKSSLMQMYHFFLICQKKSVCLSKNKAKYHVGGAYYLSKVKNRALSLWIVLFQ